MNAQETLCAIEGRYRPLFVSLDAEMLCDEHDKPLAAAPPTLAAKRRLPQGSI
jgi:hypothetical protein